MSTMSTDNKPLPKPVMFILFFILGGLYFLYTPPAIDTANLTTASATMSNSRFSYRAAIGATSAVGSSYVIVSSSTSNNVGNTSNSHLFPKDTLCFWDSASTSCIDSTTYTVNAVGTGNTDFNINKPLGTRLVGGSYALVNQATYLTISFVLGTSVPSDGDIQITIPAANQTAALNRDGMANTQSSIANNGWDLASLRSNGTATTMSTGDVYVTAGGTWTTSSITAGTSGGGHIIVINASSTVASGTTVTINVGSTAVADATHAQLTNPAPISSTHVNGVADAYTITVKTRDGSDATLDTVDIKAAPVDGVLVSATVDESLALTIAGRALSTVSCGSTADVATTAVEVPWGTLSTANTFYNAAQQVTVSTNGASGYDLTIEENDQMGKDGVAGVGATAGELQNVIKDTTCDGGTCTSSLAVGWTGITNNGFGFSLENVSGGHTAFSYGGGALFSARQIADQEVPETKQNIMTHTLPVSADSVYVCYRISISNTQPAGYYFNKVKYTAIPKF